MTPFITAIGVSAEANTNKSTGYVELLTDVEVYDSSGKLMGKLFEGSIIKPLKISTGSIEIQWGSSMGIIDSEADGYIETTEINQTVVESFIPTDTTEIIKDSILLDEETGLKGELYSGFEIPIMKKDDRIIAAVAGIIGTLEIKDLELETAETEEVEENEETKEVPVVEQQKDSNKEIIPSEDVTTDTELDRQTDVDGNQDNLQSGIFNTDYFKVQDQAIVYSDKDLESDQKAILKQNEVYLRLHQEDNWHVIAFGEGLGYVPVEGTVEDSGETVVMYTSNPSDIQIKLNQNATLYESVNGVLKPIATMLEGMQTPVEHVMGDWYAVHFSGRLGYIYYTAVDRDFKNDDSFFTPTEENVSIYQSINGSLKLIGNLIEGQQYERIRNFGDWHEIAFADRTAYIWKGATKPIDKVSYSNKSLLINSNTTMTTKERVPVFDNSTGTLNPYVYIKENERVQIVRKLGDWYEVNVAGRFGYIYKTGLKRDFDTNDMYFSPTEKSVSIYKSVNGQLIHSGYLEMGQEYKRIRNYGDWHQIVISNEYGYVWKDATEPTDGLSIKNGNASMSAQLPITINGRITVYDNTSGQLIPFAILSGGQRLHSLYIMGDWYAVNIGNRLGYIYKDGVRRSFSDHDKFFTAIQDNVSVYEQKDGKLVHVGTLTEGQEYQRVSNYGDWHRIKIGNKNGYVWKEATVPSNGSQAKNYHNKQTTKTEILLTDVITIYDNTNDSLTPFGVLQKGMHIGVISSYGDWYEVDFSGRIGYIYKSGAEIVYSKIINPRKNYSYHDLMSDLPALKLMYPDLISYHSIGKSVEGRNIFAVKLGKGDTEILFSGSQHAREHMTTNLLMEMLETYASSYRNWTLIDYHNTRNILNNTSIWFIPMINPDGVTLVQEGHTSAKNPEQVLRINNYNPDFSAWKANIRGVDLNRQYPANWLRINSPAKPSHKDYKGSYPLSEPEALAVYNFVNGKDFKTLMDFHSSGELIYWFYEQAGAQYDRDYQLALRMASKTGYRAVAPELTPGDGAFSDWFTLQYKRPGFTPEIAPYVYEQPVPIHHFDRIWNQNDSIGLMLALEAYQNKDNR
ncbi:M14 family zinc carboxypeptidase [Sutcliffiella sp. NPDC057660]|uniref:M14 family zinc carboxypeptidase n=1 Tax=Sutcliffiella sp. NPDC057660 TaxID=3346199 RepID=UPI0036B3992F